MSTEVITYQEVQSLAETFAKSGYFQDARDMAQAVVKIMAGRELGLGPVASMTGVYIVKGKPALSANLLAGVLKKSGRYDYRVLKLTESECEIVFYQGKEEIGRSLFTKADAIKAGTQNLDKFPRNMLFARAFTNGARWYTPDIFAGGIYTPEELGELTDGETGEVIEGKATEVEPVTKAKVDEVVATAKVARATSDKVKPASVKTQLWHAMCDTLGAKYPHYANKDGGSNFYHISMAAAKCGFAEVTDENIELVQAALEEHAQEKA